VADVVKACRPQPFGEWVVAYYDAEKTTPDRLLERLKKNGCEKATRVEPVESKSESRKAAVANPIAVPGDWFVVDLEGFDKAPAVSGPEKWTVALAGKKRAVIATPADAKAGKHKLKVGDWEFEVELVPIVR